MHEVPLRRTKHFPKPNLSPSTEASDSFDRRGLLDLPVSLPSIPLLNPLVTPLIGGPKPKPTPTPGNNNPNPASPSQQSSPQPASVNIPDLGNGNGSENGGGDNTPNSLNSGGGNTGVPNPNPNISPNSNPNTPNPNSNSPPPPNPNPNIPPNPATPTSNPDSPDPNVSDPSHPSPTSGVTSSQSSGIPQNDSVHLSESDPQNPNPGDSGDSLGGLDGSGNVFFTTISGVKTEVTRLPRPSSGDGSTSGGNGLVNGDGNGSGNGANSSGGGGLGGGIIAAIVICGVLVLALLLCLLRKRVKERRAVQRTRWLSSDEKGPRTTIRSSFGDLRASTFGYQSDDGSDTFDIKRNSGPFSDKMAVPTFTTADPSDPEIAEVTHLGIVPPAIAVHSIGKRSSRNSLFSIGSSETGGSDFSEIQWVEIRPLVGYRDNASPTDQFRLPSPISVRPFTPTESWLFPKPPNSRVTSVVINRESKVSLVSDPFADPVPRPPSLGFPPVEMVMRTFEPEAVDELVVEIGDEVSVLSVFDDGWGRVKVLRRNGSTEGVRGLEGLIPIDCLKPGGNKDANFQYTQESMFDVGKFSSVWSTCRLLNPGQRPLDEPFEFTVSLYVTLFCASPFDSLRDIFVPSSRALEWTCDLLFFIALIYLPVVCTLNWRNLYIHGQYIYSYI